MAIFRESWDATDNYAAGDLINYQGVVYEALSSITGNANNQNPCEASNLWQVSYVERVESLNSIIEIVRQELNVDDETTNNSVVEFVQRGSEYVRQRLRPPTNLISTTVDTVSLSGEAYEGRIYIAIPTDLLQVENIRLNRAPNNGGSGLINNGLLEIKAAQTEQNFEVVQQYYANDNSIFGVQNIANYTTPVYRYRTIGGVPYFELAPSELGVGTSIEIVYWRAEPELGTQHPRVNSEGEAVNSAGQTLAQWVAEGNSSSTFVQQQVRIENNWYVSNAPYCIVYAALFHAAAWLKDTERSSMWKNLYAEEESRVEDMIYRFQEDRPFDQQMFSPYSA